MTFLRACNQELSETKSAASFHASFHVLKRNG